MIARRVAHRWFLAFCGLCLAALVLFFAWLWAQVQETTRYRHACHERGGVLLEVSEPGSTRGAFCARMPEEIEP